MMQGYLLLLFSFFLLGNNIANKDLNSWKKVKDTDGIMVYTKNSDSTNLKIVKITTRVQATLSSLVELVKDARHQSDWVYLSENSRVLKAISPHHWIFYGQTNAPWPVTDRDVVSNVILQQNPHTKTVTITSTSIKGYYPPQENFVRLPYAYSQWKFQPLHNGNVLVTLIVEVNVGGHIPHWLMRLTAAKGPYYTMRNFIRELKKEKYAKTRHSYISEPQP